MEFILILFVGVIIFFKFYSPFKQIFLFVALSKKKKKENQIKQYLIQSFGKDIKAVELIEAIKGKFTLKILVKNIEMKEKLEFNELDYELKRRLLYDIYIRIYTIEIEVLERSYR